MAVRPALGVYVAMVPPISPFTWGLFCQMGRRVPWSPLAACGQSSSAPEFLDVVYDAHHEQLERGLGLPPVPADASAMSSEQPVRVFDPAALAVVLPP